jgi:arsenate reductase
MPDRVYNVLFLCTHNSARSIIAEALLNQLGAGRFRAYSAGSFPGGSVNHHALELLARMEIPTAGLRSKSWDEFTRPDAPHLDFVITVCDDAAGQICPVWTGQPVTAHWSVPDPAVVSGSELEQVNAFREAFRNLERRIRLFLDLPHATLDRLALGERLRAIGAR